MDGLHMVKKHQLSSNDSKVEMAIGNELVTPFKVKD